MKPKVSLETTIASCLRSWVSRDLVIANATLRPIIEAIRRDSGYEPPVICTPQELLETDHMTFHDTVVEEVRKAREEYARKICADLQEQEWVGRAKVVSLPKRAVQLAPSRAKK